MLLPFELLFCDIKTNDLTTSQNDSIKSQLFDTAYISCNFEKRKRAVSYLSEEELNALGNLIKNEDLVFQKPDNVVVINSVIIINKNNYKTKTTNIHKFSQIWET